MKKPFLILATISTLLISCGETEQAKDESVSTETKENIEENENIAEEPVIEDEAPIEKVTELAAINDETRIGDGAVECITQQFALIQEGKFDEALEYYSAKRKKLVMAEIAENPSIKDEWQKALSNIPEEDFNAMIESIKEHPDFFVFEDGMWRRTDK